MLIGIIIFLVSICYIIICFKTRGIQPAKRSEKVVGIIRKILHIAPIIGIGVFAVLFKIVFRNQIIERSSHALIVFGLWVLLTSMYMMIISFFTNRNVLMAAIIDAVITLVLIVILTPLDRYISVLYSKIHQFTYLIGLLLIIIFYSGLHLQKRKI